VTDGGGTRNGGTGDGGTGNGGTADLVDPATGLRPRPPVPPEVLAAVAAAVQQLTSTRRPAVPPADTHQAWRFSGRWWHRPLPTRRARPYPSRQG
jgi:hypothetical protein